MHFSKDIYIFKWWQLFIAYISLYIVITWLLKSSVYTDAFYYSAFNSQLSSERIAEIIQINTKFLWLSYVAIPIILLLKWMLIAGIIYSGLFLFNQTLLFKTCFKIIMIAELANIMGALIKVLCFLIHKPETIQDIQFFYPLSLIQLFTVKQLPTYMIYPLQQFNLFELAYWLFIAAGIKAYTEKSFKQSFKIVASSYGVGLGIWVLCVVFIQLQFA